MPKPSPHRSRDKLTKLLQTSYQKSEIAFKHAIGLGRTPNVIPVAVPLTSGPARQVLVGWHPVGGTAGKWFAEKTGLGQLITEKVKEYPDPTQHWAVLVGNYAHQLWMDEDFNVIYTNAEVGKDEWRTFPVGETCFNDDAIRRAGEAVIQQIRTTRPGYNLISNNCQTYVLQLLDAIRVSQVKEFGTTLAVYQRLFGTGKVSDLFMDQDDAQGNPQPCQSTEQPVVVAPLEGQELGVVDSAGNHVSQVYQHPEGAQSAQPEGGVAAEHNSVLFAQQVMNANTTQLNAEEQMSRGVGLAEEHAGERGEEQTKGRRWGEKAQGWMGRLKW